MNTVIVDTALGEKIRAAGNLIEFRDQRGQLICIVMKETPPLGYVIDGVLPSSEELDRIERESPRVTPEQVMERLRQLREKLS